MTCRPAAIRCLKFHEWPERDQALWIANCTPTDPFEDPHYGAKLRPDSLVMIRKGYGRWLCFLAARNWLDPDVDPIARVSRQRLRLYFHELRAAGNADATIIGRFCALRMAMKILAPTENTSWINKPYGSTIYSSLPRSTRPLLVPDSGVLFSWGLQMMDAAGSKVTRREQLCAFRDGLLIAMLASRARRLRSMSLLRIGVECLQQGGHYRIHFDKSQVKTNKPDHFGLPERLTPYIDRYLSEIRIGLLAGKNCDAFWISARGDAWKEKAIQNQISELSRQRFGVAFGPHRFRHALATTASLGISDAPGLPAALLGISSEVVRENYNRAEQAAAAILFASIVESSAPMHTHTREKRLANRRTKRPALPSIPQLVWGVAL